MSVSVCVCECVCVCDVQGIQLMSEGLGALENIGKKTMEVLTEGDPGEPAGTAPHVYQFVYLTLFICVVVYCMYNIYLHVPYYTVYIS